MTITSNCFYQLFMCRDNDLVIVTSLYCLLNSHHCVLIKKKDATKSHYSLIVSYHYFVIGLSLLWQMYITSCHNMSLLCIICHHFTDMSLIFLHCGHIFLIIKCHDFVLHCNCLYICHWFALSCHYILITCHQFINESYFIILSFISCSLITCQYHLYPIMCKSMLECCHH